MRIILGCINNLIKANIKHVYVNDPGVCLLKTLQSKHSLITYVNTTKPVGDTETFNCVGFARKYNLDMRTFNNTSKY